MSKSISPQPDTIANIDGWSINITNVAEAVAKIIQSAKKCESFSVFTLNLDHLDKLRRLPRFREAYSKARYITADGAPIVMLAARQGTRVERTTGADLIEPLVIAAAQNDIPMYLFGTTEDVLEKASTYLKGLIGEKLRIAGAEAPPSGFNPETIEADQALDRIAESGAGLCLVALGAPKQELLAARAVDRNINVGFVCIGAGLDFLAGTQRRAPRIFQQYGMEWAWRLATNPRRLASRYARCALILADLTFLRSSKAKVRV